MDIGKFNCRRPSEADATAQPEDYRNNANPLQQVVGDDLIEFRPRIPSAEQVSSINVRGWDPEQKQLVLGSAQPGTVAASVQKDPSSLAGTFGGQTYTAVDRPLAQQGQVDAVAASIAEGIANAFAEADRVARGNPS